MKKAAPIVYEIMHEDRKVAQIDQHGHAKIYCPSFMPYSLYLEDDDEDIDTLVNNITNFYYWCSTRVLTLDRKYAKEILNSVGLQQAVTDKDRAMVALTYRCASITDIYWVKTKDDNIRFSEINLYENHLDNTFIDISLRGKQYTVQNDSLARDLATNGVFPKAWQRRDDGFWLLKDGGKEFVERELLASQICRCFDVDQVLYEKGSFAEEPVSISKNFTSLEYSISSMEAVELWTANHETDLKQFILKLDRHNYYMMNIVDYLIGNTDRHWGNWGILVENASNEPVSLHKLMDFNQAFQAYDTLDGANCQTLFGVHKNQREAAEEAVREIGLNQLRPVKKEIFRALPHYYEMFLLRFEHLKKIEKN